jgi:hypothetical protein
VETRSTSTWIDAFEAGQGALTIHRRDDIASNRTFLADGVSKATRVLRNNGRGAVMNAFTARFCGGLAILVAAFGLCQPVEAAEEGTITVFSAWEGQGNTYQTGPKEATFVGVITGRMYVETDKGPVESGTMICPATVKIGLEDGKQRGSAGCTITAKDGAQIYAEVTCTGVFLVGCTGDFKLTGGSARFEGISGGGKAIIRSSFREITPVTKGATKDVGSGILYLKDLAYKIP